MANGFYEAGIGQEGMGIEGGEESREMRGRDSRESET